MAAMLLSPYSSLEDKCCSSPPGPYICGCCGATLDLICLLHSHMTKEHLNGSYHYDSLIKTAFPKYDSCCNSSQTTKQDKRYMKNLRRSNTGNPPQTVDGLEVQTEVSGNRIIIKSMETIPSSLVNSDHCHSTQYMLTQSKHAKITGGTSFIEPEPVDNCATTAETIKQEQETQEKNPKLIDSPILDSLKTPEKIKNENTDTGTMSEFFELDKITISDYMDEDTDDNLNDIELFRAHTFNDNIKKHAHDTSMSSYSSPPDLDVLKDDSAEMTQETSISVNGITRKSLRQTVRKNRKPVRKRKRKSLSKMNRQNKSHAIERKSKYDDDDDDFNEFDVSEGNLGAAKKIKKRTTMTKTCMQNSLSCVPKKTKVTLNEAKVVKNKGNIEGLTKSQKKNRYKNKRIICHICGMAVRQITMEGHMNEHLGVNPYVCDVCAKAFPRLSKLKRHQQHHYNEMTVGRFKCAECGRNFIDKVPYVAHLRSHSGDKPHQCEQCGAVFAVTKYLRRHIKEQHKVKRRPLSCTVCGMVYCSPVSLAAHLKRHAAPDLPCKYCNRLFHSSTVRTNHEWTHTDKKRFNCWLCVYGCIQKTPFFAHMLKQHGVSKDEVLSIEKTQKKCQESELPVTEASTRNNV